MNKEDFDIVDIAAELRRMRIMDGGGDAQLAKRLKPLSPEVRSFEKGEPVSGEGDRVRRIGIVLEGALHARIKGLNGKDVLLHMLSAGRILGGSSVVMDRPEHPISLVAFTDCRILAFPLLKVLALRRDPSFDFFFREMNRQMFEAMSELMCSCAILRQPRLEDRILTYLRQQCAGKGTKTVVIPSTEADFADYLGVHSVALSRCLSRMKAKGLIAYRRNVLTLLK